MNGTTKSNGQKDCLDRFYTPYSVAKECIDLINLNRYDCIIEPSAGAGAFSSQISNCLAYDISPQQESIKEQDFFHLDFTPFLNKKVLIIGNPPFGQQATLAIKFFNQAAKFADTIAFILPKSFKKNSIQNKLDLNFHLIAEKPLDNCIFELPNKQSIMVPCVFQIWEKMIQPREKIKKKTTTSLFIFTTKDLADFRIQRVGGNAGKASTNLNVAVSSNYFVKNTSNFSNEELIKIINESVFPSIEDTVGPKSLPKGELIEVLEEQLL